MIFATQNSSCLWKVSPQLESNMILYLRCTKKVGTGTSLHFEKEQVAFVHNE